MKKFEFSFNKKESLITLMVRFIGLLYKNGYCNEFMYGYYVGSLHHYLFNNSGLYVDLKNEELD